MIWGLYNLGDRIHSLFPPALAVNILGHVDIRVTQNVAHNLRPCAFALHTTGTQVRKLPKLPSISGIARVRISAQAVC
jgi:hypothetical protein